MTQRRFEEKVSWRRKMIMVHIKKFVDRRKSVFFALLLLFLTLSVWMMEAPSAFAQTTSGGPATLHHSQLHPTSFQTAVLCSGKGCNHQDPYTMRCADSMSPVADAPLKGIGLVELEYSTVCQTNWDQVYGTHVEYLAGCVVRKAGSDGPFDDACYSSTRFSWINTNMLWSPHNLDDATGCFVELCRGGPNGQISGYYTETGSY
jgi:Protein of unknown function (DUF2690)